MDSTVDSIVDFGVGSTVGFCNRLGCGFYCASVPQCSTILNMSFGKATGSCGFFNRLERGFHNKFYCGFYCGVDSMVDSTAGSTMGSTVDSTTDSAVDFCASVPQ